MRRLIEKGLMFGNLIAVDSPVLVERYNRALQHLTGKTTALADFHIDISGYSPEIGEELGDDLYINHKGLNRQFILLTTEQKRAPLLNSQFSTARGILRQFIDANEAQLFALTARDAVAGEMVNSVLGVETPARLFDIRRITIEADTTRGTVATAAKLTGLIERFKSQPGAWLDDVLIAEMIELAKVTGDLTRNPVALPAMSFAQENFWTSHFGGLYIFRAAARPAAIAAGDKAALGPLPIAQVMDLRDRTGIARWLRDNDLVEPIIETRDRDAALILHQKMDFILAEVAASAGERLEGADRRALRGLERKYAAVLPDEWKGLAALARWAEGEGAWPRITSDHPSYFYSLRARRGADADLVNMLLAELSPLDMRQLFICHKAAFYRAYAGWPEEKRAYVADFLSREYMQDKAGVREELFGGDKAAEPARRPDMIAAVGPWGAVR